MFVAAPMAHLVSHSAACTVVHTAFSATCAVVQIVHFTRDLPESIIHSHDLTL